MRAPARSTPSPSLWITLVSVALLSSPLAGVRAASPDAEPAEARADDTRTGSPEVDCALPARIDRLSGQVTMLGARQIVQIAPEECRQRGGEVVSDGSPDEPPATGSTD